MFFYAFGRGDVFGSRGIRNDRFPRLVVNGAVCAGRRPFPADGTRGEYRTRKGNNKTPRGPTSKSRPVSATKTRPVRRRKYPDNYVYVKNQNVFSADRFILEPR